jgi:hypothetical protein
MQGLLKAHPESIVAHEQKLVVVFQKVIPTRALEPIDCPDARRASKRVEIASVLTVLIYFETRKGLGFRHEDGVDVAVICAEVGLPFDCAVLNTAFYHPKNASKFCGEHALDNETVIPQALCQLHCIGVHRITRGEQVVASGTLGRLSEQLIVRRGKEQDKAGQEVMETNAQHVQRQDLRYS